MSRTKVIIIALLTSFLLYLGYSIVRYNLESKRKSDRDALLKQTNLIHGGTDLDNLKTVRMISTTSETELTAAEIIILIDLESRKVRREHRRNGKIVQVKQIEYDIGWRWKGWRWNDDSKEAADLFDMEEIDRLSKFSRSIFDLRSKVIEPILENELVTFDEELKRKSVIIESKDRSYSRTFDTENRLISQSWTDEYGTLIHLAADDFRSVNGILFPFSITYSANYDEAVYKYFW